MATKTHGFLPSGIYAVMKDRNILGFVRGKDAGDAHRKADVIFGRHDGVTSSITIQDTEVTAK